MQYIGTIVNSLTCGVSSISNPRAHHRQNLARNIDAAELPTLAQVINPTIAARNNF